jgi:hypothetical protein
MTAATTVLPTPVSVPVTKMALFFISITDLSYKKHLNR